MIVKLTNTAKAAFYMDRGAKLLGFERDATNQASMLIKLDLPQDSNPDDLDIAFIHSEYARINRVREHLTREIRGSSR